MCFRRYLTTDEGNKTLVVFGHVWVATQWGVRGVGTREESRDLIGKCKNLHLRLSHSRWRIGLMLRDYRKAEG